ncbi:MAG TPA: serine/threonine-protein kinase [Phycisphaerales bacterium]|nr:serine/threonine-protein kinase [Phycisphaerales bacterium]
MTPPPHTTFGSGFGPGDLPPPASVRLDTDSARRLLGALGAAERDGLEAGDFDGVALPGYTLVRRLGAGASGEVFLALREGSDRPVSVKVWRQGQRGERAVRAWRELDLLGECNLAVVPRVLDYGTRAGSLFVATDYIDGLNPIARSAEMNLRERVTLLADIADAVQMLHEHGIIHRDLKPANILVTAAGRVFILDLGLAMLAQRTADTLTLEGQPVGTLGYMSPEQARGERAKVSVRSDVYSLGAIGYHLLCGDTPHRMSESASQSLLRITMTPPRDPRALSAEVPPALAAALAKAVRAEPRERYASAGEFASDLMRWARGERVLATKLGVVRRGVMWVTSHPRFVAACLVTLTVCASAVASKLAAAAVLDAPTSLTTEGGEHGRFDQATLRSATGKPLATIGGTPASVLLASFVPWPDGMDGRKTLKRVVVLATRPGAEQHSTDGQVWVCDPDRIDLPLYRSEQDATIPQRRPGDGSREEALITQRALLADVFPSNPGVEIVQLSGLMGVETRITVLSLLCEVLFEAWHFGPLHDCAWWPSQRQLVLVGQMDVQNPQPSEAIGIGAPESGTISAERTIPVLFAIRPKPNSRYRWTDDVLSDAQQGLIVWQRSFEGDRTGDRMRRAITHSSLESGRANEPDTILLKVKEPDRSYSGASELAGQERGWTLEVPISAQGQLQAIDALQELLQQRHMDEATQTRQ